MKTVKIAFAAAALVLSSGAAFASNIAAGGGKLHDRDGVATVSQSRTVETRSPIATVSMPAVEVAPAAGRNGSEPTIFGHSADQSSYVVTGEMLNVWGHKITR